MSARSGELALQRQFHLVLLVGTLFRKNTSTAELDCSPTVETSAFVKPNLPGTFISLYMKYTTVCQFKLNATDQVASLHTTSSDSADSAIL